MTTVLRVGLIAAIAVVLAAPVVVRVARHRFDPFEPIVLFVIAYGVMFVTRPAAMLISHHLAYDGPASSTNVAGTFSKMLVLALVGAVGFVTAYETFFGRRVAKRWRRLGGLDDPRVSAAALAIGAVGVTAFIAFLFLSFGGLSGLGVIFRGRTPQLSREFEGSTFYLWSSVFLLIPAVLVLAMVGLETRRTWLVVAACAFSVVFLLRTVPLGDRISLLPFVGGGFVLYYLRRGARPSAFILLGLAVIALFGSAFLSDLRGRSTRHQDVAQTFVRSINPSRILSPLFSGPDSEMAPVLAAALTRIPSELHYTYGLTIFGDLVSRPIPRAIWSDKPQPPRDKLIASLWPTEFKYGGINPEFSVLLYFFWDFGIPGVLAGMFLFGIGARAVYEYFLANRHSSAVQVLYAVILWFIVIGLRDSPVDTFVEFAFVVFPIWLVVRLPAWRSMRLAAAS